MGLYPILAKNEYCNREQYYRGVLPYLRRIISCIKRDGFHPCDQWNAGMNKYWRHSMSLNIGIIPYYYDPIENGKDPCKLPTNAIIIVGCDDTSKIQLGDLIPLEATPRQSNCAIFLSITSVLACDHDYGGVAKILPSVIHNMNQYINPGYSLYSGSPDGTGCAFLLLHDAKFYPSLGYNHAAHFNQFWLYLDHSQDREVDTSMEEVKLLA